MTLTNLLIVVWMHFYADFILQNDEMAINKSSSNKWLTIHVVGYSIPFIWFGWKFALINGLCHWITDFISSRTTTYLWKKEMRHWFFVVIGLDQALHLTALIMLLDIYA